MLSLRLFAFIAFVAVCPVAFSQYTAGKIIFKNPGPYTQADLEAVAGLHPHDKVSGSVVQAAAQRLVDTGYFDDVAAGLEGLATAIKVTFALKPMAPTQLTAVSFDNFVWFTPEELQATLHKAAPLFTGKLPEAGNQSEVVAAALQAALAGKGVTATVVHEPAEPFPLQAYRIMEYRVSEPDVAVHAIKLQGVSAEFAAEVQKAISALHGRDYREGLAFPTTADRLLAPYANAGYLDVKLVGTERTVTGSSPSAVGVDVSASVGAGEPYHVAGLTFEGTPLVTSESVLTNAKLHTGDVASRKLLVETLDPLDAAYRHQGYIHVLIDTGAKLDRASHTVTYAVTVMPGEQYRLHSVNPVGLSPETRAAFDRSWHMAPGDLFDPLYVTEYLGQNVAQPRFRGYSATFEALADPQTHEVDLTLRFVSAAK